MSGHNIRNLSKKRRLNGTSHTVAAITVVPDRRHRMLVVRVHDRRVCGEVVVIADAPFPTDWTAQDPALYTQAVLRYERRSPSSLC